MVRVRATKLLNLKQETKMSQKVQAYARGVSELVEMRDQGGDFLLLRYSPLAIIESFLVFQDLELLKKVMGTLPLSPDQFVDRVISTFSFPSPQRFFVIAGLLCLYEMVAMQSGRRGEVKFASLLDIILSVSRSMRENAHRLSCHRMPREGKRLIFPREELPFLTPVIQEAQTLPWISLELDSLRTNAKTFKTPAKFCLFNRKRKLFILVLEGIFTVFLFDSRAAAVEELNPENPSKQALGILAVDYSDEESKVD